MGHLHSEWVWSQPAELPMCPGGGGFLTLIKSYPLEHSHCLSPGQGLTVHAGLL